MANERRTYQTDGEKRLLRTGDVFTSAKLAYGHRDYADLTPCITIDGRPGEHIVRRRRPQQERLAHAAKTGEILDEYYEVEHGAYDRGRALAHFVVTRTEHPYGRHGMGGMDQGSPETHRVWAQRLAQEDAFDPEGEQVTFDQMGWGQNITPEDIVILSTLQQWFR